MGDDPWRRFTLTIAHVVMQIVLFFVFTAIGYHSHGYSSHDVIGYSSHGYPSHNAIGDMRHNQYQHKYDHYNFDRAVFSGQPGGSDATRLASLVAYLRTACACAGRRGRQALHAHVPGQWICLRGNKCIRGNT